MLEVTRVYKNSDDTIRIDNIIMRRKFPSIVTGINPPSFEREIKITPVYATGVSRTVDAIEVIGTFDAIEDSTGDYEWVTWTSPVARCSMNDLPGIGDTV